MRIFNRNPKNNHSSAAGHVPCSATRILSLAAHGTRYAVLGMFLFLGSGLMVHGPALAAVPQLLTYQGLLKNSSGSYLTGTYSMVFKIYNVSTGGTALWTETQSSVSASSGRFSVELGSVTPLNLAFNAQYWLGIQVGSDIEMAPRIKLTSVGYAYNAEDVENSFTQTDHNALSHRNVEGVKANTTNIAKTNFKLDAYSLASANSMGDMLVDTFTDASGISSGSSTDYSWRGTPNYDVTLASGGIDSSAIFAPHCNGTNGSTTITDSSSTSHSPTAGTSVTISTSQSKFGSASCRFGAATSYVSIPNNAVFNFGTGNFTIEMWIRIDANGDHQVLMSDAGEADWIIFYYNKSQWVVRLEGGAGIIFSGGQMSADTWYHVALVRSGTDMKLFLNGTQVGSTGTSSANLQTSSAVIIGRSPTNPYVGTQTSYIDEVRLSNVARWTSNFTAPSAEYAAPSSSATVISTAYSETTAPAEAMVIASETLNSGSITYYVSRDNGTTWTACTKETVTSISSQPSGTNVRWKAVITGNAELEAIAVAL